MATYTPDGGKLVQVIGSQELQPITNFGTISPSTIYSDPVYITNSNVYASVHLFISASLTTGVVSQGNIRSFSVSLISRDTLTGGEVTLASGSISNPASSGSAVSGSVTLNPSGIIIGSGKELRFKIASTSGGGSFNSAVIDGAVLVYQKPA